MPRVNTSSISGKFNDLKSRLGFSGKVDDDYDYDEYGDYEDYDDYDEYDDYGDDYDAEADDGDAYDDVTTRAPGARRSSSAGLSGDRRGGVTYPSLVNRADVRATTPTPPVDDVTTRSSRRTSSFGRESAGRAHDFAYSGTEYDTPPEAAVNNAERRSRKSAGYESMFASTTPATGAGAASAGVTAPIPDLRKPASAVGVGTHPSTSGYDPYDTYQGTGASRHSPERKLSVMTPISYGEVESVARTLKAGDVVVLSLRNTPNQLAKRILDFSFGVASALDANVDCVADKVFVVARGGGLTDAETAKLRGQGVL